MDMMPTHYDRRREYAQENGHPMIGDHVLSRDGTVRAIHTARAFSGNFTSEQIETAHDHPRLEL